MARNHDGNDDSNDNESTSDAPRSYDRERPDKFNPRFKSRRKRKVSKFDEWGIKHIDYKDIERLKEFLTEHGKILSRRITGSRAKHQRSLTIAIKRARYMALLPYVGKIVKERGEGPPRGRREYRGDYNRGPRGPRPDYRSGGERGDYRGGGERPGPERSPERPAAEAAPAAPASED